MNERVLSFIIKSKRLISFVSMKRMMLSIVFSLMLSLVYADANTVFCGLPDSIAEQYGELYVCQQGRVCHLRNLCDARHRQAELSELFIDGRNLKLFPYATADSVVWYASGEPLPAKMKDDEVLFVTKVQRYMLELAEQNDYEALSEVIAQVRNYQLKNGSNTIPATFVDSLDDYYSSRCNQYILWVVIWLGFLPMSHYFRKRYHDEYDLITRSGLRKLCLLYSFVALCYYTFLIVTRWIVGGHVPLTSGHEVMLFLTWCILLTGLVDRNRHSSVLPTSILASLIIGLGVGTTDATITGLSTALDSPWLGFHVAVTIASYSFFIMMAINGIRGLFLLCKGRAKLLYVEKLRSISRNWLIPGTICLAAGIVMGGFWAQSAWGSFWSWDPKETWALLTLVVYGLGYLPWLRSAKVFHIFSVVAILFVLFTYFGVNYLLGGLHGYV